MANDISPFEVRTTSYAFSKDIYVPIKTFLASKNVCTSKIINSFWLALLRGDITIDIQEIGDNRMNRGITINKLEDVYDVVFMDSKGNILKTDNPNEIEGGII